MTEKVLNFTARSLEKDEVLLLLDFIDTHNIITTKAANATNNKLKEEAWKVISQKFNCHLGVTRRPEQLRLKWENLKKAARKRSAAIRQNNLKTGGGKSFIGPDEVLDRVAGMLGATCSGFTVEFGGDREEIDARPVEDAQVALAEDEPNKILLITDGSTACESSDGGGVVESQSTTHHANLDYAPKKILFNTPNNTKNKRQKLNEQVHKAHIEKELALAAYFRSKTAKMELENINLKCEIEKMQNQTN